MILMMRLRVWLWLATPPSTIPSALYKSTSKVSSPYAMVPLMRGIVTVCESAPWGMVMVCEMPV